MSWSDRLGRIETLASAGRRRSLSIASSFLFVMVLSPAAANLWAAGVRHCVLLADIRDQEIDDSLIQRMVVGVVKLKHHPMRTGR